MKLSNVARGEMKLKTLRSKNASGGIEPYLSAPMPKRERVSERDQRWIRLSVGVRKMEWRECDGEPKAANSVVGRAELI